MQGDQAGGSGFRAYVSLGAGVSQESILNALRGPRAGTELALVSVMDRHLGGCSLAALAVSCQSTSHQLHRSFRM